MNKLLLLLLLCIPFGVNAKALAFTNNTAGGQIILDDQEENCGDGAYRAFTTHPDGTVIVGCWTVHSTGQQIVILWDGDNIRYYDVDLFIRKQYNDYEA